MLDTAQKKCSARKCRNQNTIGAPVSFSGIGIHTGLIVDMRFCPAEPGAGVYFKRTDLPGQPIIPATLEYVCDTARSTTIGVADVHIFTVEHVLAAVSAFEIDNLCIEISSLEPPVGNGSSDVFVKMIEEVGVVAQDKTTPIVYLKNPVYWSEEEIHIVAIPSDEYRISYVLNYPDTKAIRSQYHSTVINRDSFKKELAPCRTFSRYNEVIALTERGLIKGGSLDNAVIIKDDVIFSKEGLFFSDEMVRHKMLDMVGDLSLLGYDFRAHIISVRSGHKSNLAFGSNLFKSLTLENP